MAPTRYVFIYKLTYIYIYVYKYVCARELVHIYYICVRADFARLRVRDNDNGTYTVAYTPEIGGDYYISVKHNGWCVVALACVQRTSPND